MICYEFTPIISPGTTRYSQFAKYLSKFGWEPVILTIRNPSRFWHLNSSLKPPKNLKIYRSFELPTIYVWKFLKKIFKKSIFSFRYIGWLPSTIINAYRIIKKEQINLIFAGCQPFSVALIGIFLKALTKKPLVLDFRDPLIWARSLEVKIIDYCVRNADLNLIVTKSMREFFKGGNFAYLPNGYTDFPITNKLKSVFEEKFTIVYAGTIYPGSNAILKNFLLAIKDLIKIRKNLVLSFIGYEHRKILMPIISDIGLDLNQVEFKFLGHLTYEKCLDLIKQASATLIFRPSTFNFGMSSKIFDYLHSEGPILGILDEENEAAQFIKKANCGIVVSKTSQAILAGLKKLVRNKDFQRNNSFIKKFHRRELTERLVTLLDKIVEGYL